MDDRASGAGLAGSGSAATILVVDDDAAIRRVFVAALRHAGYDTLEAAGGEEAIALLGTHSVDLALLDMDMPGLSGTDLANQVRADRRHESMGIIFVSGDGALHSKLAGLQAGGNDYLVKPVALAELLARVSAQLRDRSLWLARLDQQLATRYLLARRIADLDPSLPVALLERELLNVLSADLQLLELTISPPSRDTPDRDAELAIEATGGGTLLRVPLRYAGTLVGVLQATVEGPPDRALSTLTDLSLQLGAVIADVAARQDSARDARVWVEQLVATDSLSAVYQPIVSLANDSIIGFEGLTRFADGTRPDIAFARAAVAGVGPELEISAIERLLASASGLPPDAWLSLNVSAATLLTGRVDDLLRDHDRALVLEVTEREHVHDYTAVRDMLARLPGVRLAVDDAGAGYASLRHIFELRPDFIKLDRHWISGIDRDPVRQALVHGLIGFTGTFEARMVGEGVERREEAATLRALGVPLAQGFLFGRPSANGRRGHHPDARNGQMGAPGHT